MSADSNLEIGVPQGSILGPLLFILYSKELEDIALKYGFSVHLYADDSQIYFSFDPKNTNEQHLSKLEECFKEIKLWMTINFLKLNDSKTEIVEIYGTSSQSTPISSFTLDSCIIKPATSARNLGYTFDNHLTLDAQVQHISQICYMNLRNIGRIGTKLTKQLKIQLVHSCIHSILDNGNATFGSLTAAQLYKLQKIQNAAVRFIFGLRGKQRFQSISPFLKELHFLPVKYRILYKISLMVFKCINNIAPKYLSNLLHLRNIGSHSLRLDNDYFHLSLPSAPKLAKTEGAFSYIGPKTWNELPYRIRAMTDVTAFKSLLKTHYFKRAFECNDEFC